MTLLDLSSYLGLGAAGAITINLLLGILISMRYSPVRKWPYRHFNIFALHRWVAYCAIILMASHPLVLLFVKQRRFSIADVVWPAHSYLQPKINLTGAIALYVLLFVLVSSLLRTRVGRPIWRKLHYLVFPAVVLLFVHSIFTDPNLKDGHPDLLDGGKVFLYCAALVATAATIVRIWLRGRGLRPAMTNSHVTPRADDPA
jgi:predicted ferric reductase